MTLAVLTELMRQCAERDELGASKEASATTTLPHRMLVALLSEVFFYRSPPAIPLLEEHEQALCELLQTRMELIELERRHRELLDALSTANAHLEEARHAWTTLQRTAAPIGSAPTRHGGLSLVSSKGASCAPGSRSSASHRVALAELQKAICEALFTVPGYPPMVEPHEVTATLVKAVTPSLRRIVANSLGDGGEHGSDE